MLRSPQLVQSLGSLTVALRDGGLEMIGEALGLRVKDGGRVAAEGAVEAFVAAYRDAVREEEGQQ